MNPFGQPQGAGQPQTGAGFGGSFTPSPPGGGGFGGFGGGGTGGGGFGVGGGGFGGGGFGANHSGGFGGGAPPGGPIVFGGGGSAGPLPPPSSSTGTSLPQFPPPAAVTTTENDQDEQKKSERAARFQTKSLSVHATPFDQRTQGFTLSANTAPFDQTIGQQQPPRKSRKKHIVGICEDMCPAQERERRQNMSDIQIFERVHPENMNLTSAELAVKRFARTVDDPHPSEFRTRGALERTMAHLRALLDREDVRFGLVHKFLWDRYRSVRQDLYIQGITDEFAVGIFEEIVRFHVMCEHELCGEDQSITDMEGFNSHLNMEQMNKALISLNDMYERAAERGTPCPTEPEFRAYHLLSLMAQHGKFKGDQQAFLSTLQSLRENVREDARIQWVLKLRSAYYFGNFARFFRLVGEAPYLLSCLAHVYFPHMRSTCFKVMSETCAKQQSLEASWLVRSLLLDDAEEALRIAKDHGFLSSLESGDRDPVVILTKGGFEKPETVFRYPSKAVSAKAGGMRRSDLIRTKAEDHQSSQQAALLRSECIQKSKDVQQRHQKFAEVAEKEACRRREQEEEARRRQMEEDCRRQAAEEELRKKQEEMRKREEELARKRLEEELSRKRLEEEVRQKRMEEERQRRIEEELRQKRIEEEQSRKILEEELRRKRLEEELRQKKIEEELRRKRLEEELRQKKIEEERRRQHLLGKLREAILARRYWDTWLTETRERLAEKERRRITKLNLQGCRVGVQVGRAKRRRREGDTRIGGSGIDGTEGLGNLGDFEDLNYGVDECRIWTAPSIVDIIEPVLVEKREARDVSVDDREADKGAQRIYWKVPVLSRHKDISGDPLARRLRARAFQDCSMSMDIDSGASLGTTGDMNVVARSRGELIYQRSGIVSSCMHFVPGWNPVTNDGNDENDIVGGDYNRDNLAWHMAGSSGLILVDVDARTLSRALKAASSVWKGPKLPVLVVAREGTVPSYSMESGHHVRVVPMDEAIPESISWLASAGPPQPSFIVTRLKECISQGIRSMVYSSSREEAAIELVLGAIDDAHESVEARWQWPPREFDMREDEEEEGDLKDDKAGTCDDRKHDGALNEWWKGYQRLVHAVRNIYVSIGDKKGLSLLTVNQVLDKYDEPFVLPTALRNKYDALFELSTVDHGAIGGIERGVDVGGARDDKENMRRRREVTKTESTENINKGSGKAVSLQQRLAALDEEIHSLRIERKRSEQKRGLLFGLLDKLW